MPPPTRTATMTTDTMRLITGLDDATLRVVSRTSAAADGAIQPRQGDPIIRQGLALGVLGLGEGELGVRQLEDGADTGVEPPLGQAKVLLGGGHQGLRRQDPLLGLLDGDLGLLDILDNVQLGGLHACPRALEVGLRLLVSRDPPAAVEERPGKRQAERPGLVELALGTPVGPAARDVREEVAKSLPLRGLGSGGAELGLAVLGSLPERIAPELLPVQREGLVDEVVHD